MISDSDRQTTHTCWFDPDRVTWEEGARDVARRQPVPQPQPRPSSRWNTPAPKDQQGYTR